jgi:hypothetical protein
MRGRAQEPCVCALPARSGRYSSLMSLSGVVSVVGGSIGHSMTLGADETAGFALLSSGGETGGLAGGGTGRLLRTLDIVLPP